MKDLDLNYRVTVGYTDFYFEDGQEALRFAETAKLTVDNDCAVDIRVLTFSKFLEKSFVEEEE